MILDRFYFLKGRTICDYHPHTGTLMYMNTIGNGYNPQTMTGDPKTKNLTGFPRIPKSLEIVSQNPSEFRLWRNKMSYFTVHVAL